jgi:hypothetical protein
VALYVTLWPTASAFDTKDVASIVKLDGALRAGPTLMARIVDTRWEALGKDEQKRLAAQVFERETQKGIRAMTLVDGLGRTRVTASDAPSGRNIFIN